MSGNYQSRVFTFINKRTNHFKDTCVQGFRHIKVAVIWSGQALLYPFHLLAQTTKIFQAQITPPISTPVLPPVSDINIEQALELVVAAGYPIVIAERGSLTASSLPEASPPQIATGETTRSIIFSEDSSNLGYYDPDTDDWEVASYSPRRSAQPVVARKPVIHGLGSLLVDRQLVLITTNNEILDILTSSQQQEIRRRIGVDLAIDWYQWSTGEILDDQILGHLALDRATTAQRAIASSSEDNLQALNLFDRLQDWFQKITANSQDSIRQSGILTPEKPDQIESNLPHQITPASYVFTPQPPTIDRWLNLPQLPPIHESDLGLAKTGKPIQQVIQQTLTQIQPQWLKQWWHYYREYLSIPTTDFDQFTSSQITHQLQDFQLTRLDQPRDEIDHKADKSNNIVHRQSLLRQSSGKLDRKVFQNVEFNPDWIETEAEQVGYSRSLITQLLEWIDRLLLQIENWVIKAWNTIAKHKSKT